MARAKQTEYAYFDDGDIALYHRPGTKAYQARIKLEGGKSLVRSTGTENLQDALKWARREKIANETKIELGLDPTGRTFKYVAERWLGSLDAKKERQVRDYTRIVTRYLVCLGQPRTRIGARLAEGEPVPPYLVRVRE